MRMQLVSIAIAVAAVCPRPALAQQTKYHAAGKVGVEHGTWRVSYRSGAVVSNVAVTVSNTGSGSTFFDMTARLPEKSTLTSLEVHRDGRWQKARVLAAKKARASYRSAIVPGGQRDRLGPVMAEWIDDSSFSVEVWPLPAATKMRLRYRTTSYPCVYAGHYAVEIPASTVSVVGGRELTNSSKLRKTLIGNCPGIDGAGTVVAFAGPRRGLTASWATRPLESRSIADLRVLVGELSRQPVGASVVFVLDTSYSQGKDGIGAQLARVRDFAAELPSGRYQLVAYRRYAHPVLRKWTSGTQLDAVLDELPERVLALGNGSRLDRGIAQAMTMLKGRRGPLRVVAFTDERLAQSTSPKRFGPELARLAPRGTVVHLVRPDGNEYQRVWDGPFAELASTLGGVHAAASSGAWSVPASMTELVRPKTLERVTIARANGEELDELPTISGLREGQGYSNLFALSKQADGVVVEGLLWNRRLRTEVPRSSAASRHLPAFAIAADWLTNTEGKALALAAGLLSKWTAMVAVPRKPVASRGIGAIGLRGRGTSSFCCGGCRGHGRGRVTVGGELLLALEAPVRGCMARHGSSSVALEVDTTGLEIVDVDTAQSTPLARCIGEAVWELRPVGVGASYEITRIAIEPGPKIRTTGGTVTTSRSAW